MTVVYYIKHPNGRMKITPVPASDTEAIRAFKDHWTAKAAWSVNGKRVLVKEIKEEIFAEDVFNRLQTSKKT